MTDDMQFDRLLDAVLHEAANVAPGDGLELRMLAAVQEQGSAPMADVLVFAGGLSSEGVFGSLWRGMRDLLSARRMPPLLLESEPVPVVDPMAVDDGYSSMAYAVAVHAMAVLVIGFVVRAQIRDVTPPREVTAQLVVPVLSIEARASQRTGGGGGQRGETPVSKGHLPKMVEQQIVAPSQPPLIQPKIAMEPTIEMQQVRMADNVMPNVGLSQAAIAGISLGNGRGTGLGAGDGAGSGEGSGGSNGGGLRHVGGSVSKPEVLFWVEPEFSEEARKAKASGDVTVDLWVDEQGRPTHVRVVRGMGMGLDEKALEAVKQYRFKPAMENGRPVVVEMNVSVSFHIY